MRWVNAESGKLVLDRPRPAIEADSRGKIIEFLGESVETMLFPALVMTMHAGEGALIWCDRERPPYAPTLMQHVTRTILWVRGDAAAAVECLRSKGVGATIFCPRSILSRVDTRRLQLAAEEGGGTGIVLRRLTESARHYAASLRYLVTSAPGDSLIQRWNLTLIHGHGRHTQETVTVELSRETNRLHLSSDAAGRTGIAQRTSVAG